MKASQSALRMGLSHTAGRRYTVRYPVAHPALWHCMQLAAARQEYQTCCEATSDRVFLLLIDAVLAPQHMPAAAKVCICWTILPISLQQAPRS